MPGIFPETVAGGLYIRDGAGNPLYPDSVHNAYRPAPAFVSNCQFTALPSDCTARIESRQMNAVVSEMSALAEVWDSNGPWDCNAVNNLGTMFTTWWTVTWANVKQYIDDKNNLQDADIARRVLRSGDTMQGALMLYEDPVQPMEAVTKQYLDNTYSNVAGQINTRVMRSGDTMQGSLYLAHDPSQPLEAATKQYVDNTGSGIQSWTNANFVHKSGDTMTGPLYAFGPPTQPTELTDKQYVDNAIASAVSGGTVDLSNYVKKTGDSMSGSLTINAGGTSLSIAGDQWIAGNLSMNGSITTNGQVNVNNNLSTHNGGYIYADGNISTPSTITAGGDIHGQSSIYGTYDLNIGRNANISGDIHCTNVNADGNVSAQNTVAASQNVNAGVDMNVGRNIWVQGLGSFNGNVNCTNIVNVTADGNGWAQLHLYSPGIGEWKVSSAPDGEFQITDATYGYTVVSIWQNLQRFTLPGGLLYVNDGWKVGGGPWNDASDARIKTIDGWYDSGLAEILQLQPVRYRFRGNDTPKPLKADDTAVPYTNSDHCKDAKAGTPRIGLIAQECEGAMPELIKQVHGYIDGNEVDDLRILDTGPIVFALINAVKELNAQVSALKAELQTLRR